MSDWRLTSENAAVVVVDVQDKLMAVMPRRDAVLAATQKLLRVAQVLHLPVVLTAQYPQGLGPVCAEILEAAPAVPVIEKLAFSCCGSVEFVTQIRNLHRQRILLCGVETHVCVQQTAIDLMDQDRFVYVCADAVCSRRELDDQIALERLRDCGAVITTVEAAVFEMLRQAGTEAFKQVLPLFK